MKRDRPNPFLFVFSGLAFSTVLLVLIVLFSHNEGKRVSSASMALWLGFGMAGGFSGWALLWGRDSLSSRSTVVPPASTANSTVVVPPPLPELPYPQGVEWAKTAMLNDAVEWIERERSEAGFPATRMTLANLPEPIKTQHIQPDYAIPNVPEPLHDEGADDSYRAGADDEFAYSSAEPAEEDAQAQFADLFGDVKKEPDHFDRMFSGTVSRDVTNLGF